MKGRILLLNLAPEAGLAGRLSTTLQSELFGLTSPLTPIVVALEFASCRSIFQLLECGHEH